MAQYKIVTTVEEGHGFRGSDFEYQYAETVAERNSIINASKGNAYATRIVVIDELEGIPVAEYARTPRNRWKRDA